MIAKKEKNKNTQILLGKPLLGKTIGRGRKIHYVENTQYKKSSIISF